MNKNSSKESKGTSWTEHFRQRREQQALERFRHASSEIIKQKQDSTNLQTIRDLPNMSEMISKMTCVSCSSVPSPYHRYLCANGHLFCAACGNERSWKHQSKCSGEICRNKILKANECEPNDSSAGDDVQQKKRGKYTPHFELCQLKIKLYPADPIYTAIWLNTLWKCPLHQGTCPVKVIGSSLDQHMEECKKNASPEQFVCLGEDCFKTVPICEQSYVEHLVSHHNLYGLEMGNGSEPKLLYVPGSAVEKNKPYYAMLHCLERYFVFCMEPIGTDNEQQMRISVREICDKQNLSSENKFQCNLYLTTRWGLLKVITKFDCVPLTSIDEKESDEVHCLILSTNVIKVEHVFQCNGRKLKKNRPKSRTSAPEDEELGYFLVNLTISVKRSDSN